MHTYGEFAERAMQLLVAGKTKEATIMFDSMLGQHPDDPQMIHNVALCLQKQGLNGVAIAMIERARSLGMRHSKLLTNLANCYCQDHHFEKAERLYREAMSLPDADKAEIMANMVAIYINQNAYDKGLELCKEALKLKPKDDLILFNQCICQLEAGHWKEGWEGYHFSGLRRQDRKNRNYDLPPTPDSPGRSCPFWDGTPGETVVVYGEQGLGDEIQFASCIPDLIADCKQVIIDCDYRLEQAFKRSFPDAIVYGTTDIPDISWPFDHEIDAKIPMGSLGMFYRLTDEEFPLHDGFLRADEMKVQRWRNRLAQISDRPKVCLSWLGGFKKTRRELRSIALNQWLPVLAQPCDFISLQYSDPNGQEALSLGLHVFEEVLRDDVDEMLALIKACDLTISVNNSQVHMAGSLGCPTWTLTPMRCAWRYHPYLAKTDQAERMLFYPSVLQYRQNIDDNWEEVIGQVADDLQELCNQRAAA